ncbi:MAG: hypothetical protein HWE22_10580 [Flavobacteriales bacterium]|nr:hypothetical protein [Flavobacteriales bacterium]
MNNSQHQGKYHLLAILLIPGFLVSIFLSNSFWVPLIFGLVAAVILYLAFRKS